MNEAHIVIDCSGGMLEMGKAAAISGIASAAFSYASQMLAPMDKAWLLHVYDWKAHIYEVMTPNELQFGGGRASLDKLAEAVMSLSGRHASVLVATDGLFGQCDIDSFKRKVSECGAPISWIACGADADIEAISSLACCGGKAFGPCGILAALQMAFFPLEPLQKKSEDVQNIGANQDEVLGEGRDTATSAAQSYTEDAPSEA